MLRKVIKMKFKLIDLLRFQFVISAAVLMLISSYAVGDTWTGSINVPSIISPHPRLMMTKKMVEDMVLRVHRRDEPWNTDFKVIENNAELALYTTFPSPYTGSNVWDFYYECIEQSQAAIDLALAYKVTSREQYAQKAIDLLMDWSNAGTGATYLPQDEYLTGMLLSRSVFQFIYCYDLLYDHQLLDSADKTVVENWFTSLVTPIKNNIQYWEANGYGYSLYVNHHAANMMGLAAIGYVTGDRDLVQYALDSEENPRDFKELLGGLILMPDDDAPIYEAGMAGAPFTIQAGEIYDRYRHFDNIRAGTEHKGLQYANLSLKMMSIVAQIAANNGIDLFNYEAAGGEKLELSFAFYSDFYRTGDSTIKGGYYSGEDNRIGIVGDPAALFEIGFRNYPDNPNLYEYVTEVDRVDYQSASTIRRITLTHGVGLINVADLNEDQTVNLGDYSAIADNWLSSTFSE